MAAASSTEHSPGPAAAFRNLQPAQRLAAVGALVCAASLVLPWYRTGIGGGLSKSGFGSFSFAQAALLLTVGSALFLLFEVGRGHRPPLPLHSGTLLAAAGGWSALIVLYLMLDRPHLTVGGFRSGFELGWGLFVALGGAVTMVIAGLRVRRVEIAGRRPARRSTA